MLVEDGFERVNDAQLLLVAMADLLDGSGANLGASGLKDLGEQFVLEARFYPEQVDLLRVGDPRITQTTTPKAGHRTSRSNPDSASIDPETSAHSVCVFLAASNPVAPLW